MKAPTPGLQALKSLAHESSFNSSVRMVTGELATATCRVRFPNRAQTAGINLWCCKAPMGFCAKFAYLAWHGLIQFNSGRGHKPQE